MNQFAKLVIRSSESGVGGSVTLDGVDISQNVESISIEMAAGSIAQAHLSMFVELDLDSAAQIRRQLAFPQLETS